ncbi:MAG: MBL fold metallo-hydrolase [Anaerolineales bacterium]|nr:MBL fold metallo-hydrolase [Anaerolineales bacterium]
MPLEIIPFTLGPVLTNAYLIADPTTAEAAVIDPAWDGVVILAEAQRRGWRIGQLWYTHAHFDHIGGAADIADSLNPVPLVALHPADIPLWQVGGGGALFGFRIEPGPKPTIDLHHGQTLQLGNINFEVRHTPGHTPGHCAFYCAEANTLFSGDLIFQNGVGRTDLPGGSWETLVESIREQVFTLPEETRILSGHGGETWVGEERMYNPFVGG